MIHKGLFMIHKSFFQKKQRLMGGKISERRVKDLSGIRPIKWENEKMTTLWYQGSNNWEKLIDGWRIYSKGIYGKILISAHQILHHHKIIATHMREKFACLVQRICDRRRLNFRLIMETTDTHKAAIIIQRINPMRQNLLTRSKLLYRF